MMTVRGARLHRAARNPFAGAPEADHRAAVLDVLLTCGSKAPKGFQKTLHPSQPRSG